MRDELHGALFSSPYVHKNIGHNRLSVGLMYVIPKQRHHRGLSGVRACLVMKGRGGARGVRFIVGTKNRKVTAVS